MRQNRLVVSSRNLKIAVLLLVAGCAVAAVFVLPRMAQDPGYHRFADIRRALGLPNFLNVVSNVPFLLAGAFGLWHLPRMSGLPLGRAYAVMCAGVLLVGIGSAWYHLAPSNATLAWDRAPMTVAFMGLFALVLGDCLSERAGMRLLWPLVAAGLASVIYWQVSELRGQGDLRPYGLVQFLPMLLMPLMLILFGTTRLRPALLWSALIVYALSKLAEHLDAAIFQATGFISGHSVKHVLAAAAVLAAILAYPSGNNRAHRRNGR